MRTVTSKDGTTIAFDRSGTGPAIILVHGALQHRAFDQGTAQLADLLAQHFTVVHYDRRGRGDSMDTQPFIRQLNDGGIHDCEEKSDVQSHRQRL